MKAEKQANGDVDVSGHGCLMKGNINELMKSK